MYSTTLGQACAIADTLNATRIGLPAIYGPGRTATRYEVRPYSYRPGTRTPESWGVAERWTYDGGSDLGAFDGGFVWLPDALRAR